MTPPDLKALARGAALALLERKSGHASGWNEVYDSHACEFADAITAAIRAPIEAAARAAAFEEAAKVCDNMVIGGRAWSEEQAIAADALGAAAKNIRALARGDGGGRG